MDTETARALIAHGCIDMAVIFRTPDGRTEIHLDGMPDQPAVLKDQHGKPIHWGTLDDAAEQLRSLGWRTQIHFDISGMVLPAKDTEH